MSEPEAPKPEDPLYVPVTNVNYIPEGSEALQGFVPNHPGDDPMLNRIKASAEAQGATSGPPDEPTPQATKADPKSEPAKVESKSSK